jgi:TPR repeat protein
MLHDEPQEARNLVTTKCDRLASHPSDKAHPVGIPGVDFKNIDSARAVSACRDALRVRPNDMRIVFQLGRSLQKDGSSSATVEAARLYRLAADQGYVAAQTNLGAFYETGYGGLEKNDQEAARFYKLAADQGYAVAQYNIGRFYEIGRGGLAKNDEEAARLYKLAADQGFAVAQTSLGVLFEIGRGGLAKNDEEAARLYKLAADQGYATAQYNLGRFYEIGRSGLVKNDQEAARLYKLAADQGYAAAQTNLGVLYESGRGGLAKNDEEAARLYKLAADQGYAVAQYNLGRFYEIGRGGLAKNDEEAARLYKLAADQGYAVADHPMRIVVVRSSQPGCEPKCVEWISAEGEIVPATAELLRKIVNSLGGRKLPILIHSSGGLGNQAMLMGFLIRARGLDVAIARTVFDPCVNASGGCKQGTWSGPLGEPDAISFLQIRLHVCSRWRRSPFRRPGSAGRGPQFQARPGDGRKMATNLPGGGAN